MWHLDATSLSMIQDQHVSFTYQAPFYVLNDINTADFVWIVFHGYGQLARFFLKKFEGLDSQRHCVIAPQGLSKHYLEGFQGRVGATWMTKEDRLTELENQKTYVDAVLDSFDLRHKKIIYLGFSQGVSAACRYAVHARRSFYQLIIWAGSFPPELNNEHFQFQTESKITCYVGNDDPYYTSDKAKEEYEKIRLATGSSPELISFDGGHELKSEIITTIGNEITASHD